MDVLTGHDFRSFPVVFFNGVDLILCFPREREIEIIPKPKPIEFELSMNLFPNIFFNMSKQSFSRFNYRFKSR
jgi:hypothetical protein